MHDGYFAPGSPIWRMNREMALMLGGGRALMLQAAHPLAVAGVDQHSDYRSNPWGRLERTMAVVWTVVFGSRNDADAATARVRAIHEYVKGTIDHDMGPYPAGTPYAASDPELLLWVHATLIDTALLVYDQWVGPLSEQDQQSYYTDMQRMGKMFGIPDGYMPKDLDAFRVWWEEQLASDTICVTDVSLRTVDVILDPPAPLALRPTAELLNLVTASLMPKELREDYGLRWDPARAALLRGSRETVKRVLLPVLPDILTAVRAARTAEGRRTVKFERLMAPVLG